MRRGAKMRIEQPAVVAVVGRVHLQRDEGDRLAEVDGLHGRGELLWVLEDVLDGGAADHLGAERAGHDRAVLLGTPVERLGVGAHLGVEKPFGIEDLGLLGL